MTTIIVKSTPYVSATVGNRIFKFKPADKSNGIAWYYTSNDHYVIVSKKFLLDLSVFLKYATDPKANSDLSEKHIKLLNGLTYETENEIVLADEHSNSKCSIEWKSSPTEPNWLVRFSATISKPNGENTSIAVTTNCNGFAELINVCMIMSEF